MKNRKAKILLARRNGVGIWRWLRISNRRVRLTGCCGVMGHSCCKKKPPRRGTDERRGAQ